ncbi:hypothetical protein THMIRHAS_00470 [Thiosulfatimonas sediminis]|uniref:DUF4197 domain-containing protein n=1 Tax=Thiosulfatimonas sediminis TaxID=2675054 RepID=A0A6F8PRL2_9GAMM|nr:DUF4197 domain-containing protein [Thiosulfatimonas sediminis]BBP44674.1 hypothetical protein THMIRHAS_00470 [Thiosulfatimonas sediminis]
MKKHLMMAGLSCLLLSSQVAHANWWEKGVDMYKEMQTSQQNDDSTANDMSSQFSAEELQKAFRQALNIGAENVIAKLGVENGFNLDPKAHISLPSSLQSVHKMLDRFGYGQLTDNLELKLNQAAEEATPQAKALFMNAIQEMSFDDVRKIYQGADDSATLYLKSKTADKIRTQMGPIVNAKLQEVGALQVYEQIRAKYQSYPLVPNINADLQQHVLDKGIDSIFLYLAEQEKAIREDPAKQTTELLKKVFQK